MAISTNSIIHYTDTIDKLEAILTEGFAIKYCSEKLIIEEDMKSFAAHPIVSFCDIPLSQAYKHFKAYGRYGIGLTKRWARKLGINPVLYLDKASSISRTIGDLLKERRDKNSNLTDDQKRMVLRIKCFAKNYSGHLKRKKIDDLNYKFYDEREWRLVPEEDDLASAPFSISLSNYLKNKSKYNKTISKLRFKFWIDDISYIIVDRTKEIPRVINLIRESYSDICTDEELDILFSKICSTEQIENDY
jgi:hypothetical protein